MLNSFEDVLMCSFHFYNVFEIIGLLHMEFIFKVTNLIGHAFFFFFFKLNNIVHFNRASKNQENILLHKVSLTLNFLFYSFNHFFLGSSHKVNLK